MRIAIIFAALLLGTTCMTATKAGADDVGVGAGVSVGSGGVSAGVGAGSTTAPSGGYYMNGQRYYGSPPAAGTVVYDSPGTYATPTTYTGSYTYDTTPYYGYRTWNPHYAGYTGATTYYSTSYETPGYGCGCRCDPCSGGLFGHGGFLGTGLFR